MVSTGEMPASARGGDRRGEKERRPLRPRKHRAKSTGCTRIRYRRSGSMPDINMNRHRRRGCEMRAQLSWGKRDSFDSPECEDRGTRLTDLGGTDQEDRAAVFQIKGSSRESEVENLATALPSHTLSKHLREAIAFCQRREAPRYRNVVVFIDVDAASRKPPIVYSKVEDLSTLDLRFVTGDEPEGARKP